jgi:IS30 family transposase
VLTWPGVEPEEVEDGPVRPRTHWKRWDAAEEERLRVLFEEEGMPTSQIAEELNRSKGAIMGAISRLKLHRKPV